MQPQRFDHLRERLLRAGISPRHVKRFLGELADHFEDAVRDEELRGVTRTDAEHAADVRMGDDDHLIQGVLARPELRSFSVRYPWVVYGLGSFAAFVGALVAVTLFTALALAGAGAFAIRAAIRTQTSPDLSMWMMTAISGLRVFATYGLPLVLGAAITLGAVRQRMPVFWPIVGLVVVALLGGMTNFDFIAGPPGHRHLNVGAGFSSHSPAFEQTLIHIGANLAVLLALYAIAMKRLPDVKSPE